MGREQLFLHASALFDALRTHCPCRRALLETDPAKASVVLARFAAVLDASPLWETNAATVLLLAGHAHVIAGDAAAAKAVYARAAERLRGEYGPTSALAKLVQVR
jgi:hypothetical protein